MHRTRVYQVRSGVGARLWFGLFLFGLGAIWTLDNLGVVEGDALLQWWPLLLVAFGVTRLVGLGSPVRVAAGIVWIAIGALLIAMRVMPWDFWELWPIALIVVGCGIVWRAFTAPRSRRHNRTRVATADGQPAQDSGGAPDFETFSAVAVWSGVDRKSASREFRYGDFTAVMGGGSVNLHGATPVPEGAVVDLFVIMGGVEIVVPEDWTVVNEVFAIMGGVEDSRKVPATTGDRTLIVKGFCMMGGVEIKN